MDWKADVSESARDWMQFLGGFTPAGNTEEKEISGYMQCDDGSAVEVYLNSSELRKLSDACIEVADWLAKSSAGLIKDGVNHENN